MRNHNFNSNESNTLSKNANICESTPTVDEPVRKIQKIESNNDNTVNDMLLAIQAAATGFTLSMHNKKNFSRQDVQHVQQETQKFCRGFAEQIESLDVSTKNPDNQHQLFVCLSSMKKAFNIIDSDYKLFNHLKKIGIFAFPSIITFLQDSCTVTEEFQTDNYDRKSCLVLNNIKFQIKSFFEQHPILSDTIENTKQLESSKTINHFVNSNVWKSIIQKYAEEHDFDYTIPVWLYADEFEINDTQSSHHKIDSICGIYYNFPTLPEKYCSKICNVFVAGFIRKVVMQNVGINELVKKLVDTFKQIEEEGIIINHNGLQVKVRFVLTMLQGDNLGIHTLLRFSGGFNANFYCRFCRRPKHLLQKDCQEHENCLRTIENYNEDVATNKQSETGIAGQSEFNKLPSFHVVTNACVDAMHDVYSNGVCKYGFTSALNYFIYEKRYFSLSDLNTRINIVGKNSLELGMSRMPTITETYDKKNKSKSVVLRMTADEMRSFCNNLSFIVGPYIPPNDCVWTFCTTLMKMTDVLMYRKFTDEDLKELESLIHKHNELYLKNFDEHLKPKQHFLVHYPKVIKDSGPIYKMMCFRNEAKHQIFKEYAHIITSRTNIAYSLCLKSCLQFAYHTYNETFFESPIEGSFTEQIVKLRPYWNKIDSWPFNSETAVSLAPSCKLNGVSYKIGQFISKTENDIVQLLESEEFLKHEEDVYVICRQWLCGSYNSHYVALEAIERTDKFTLIKLDSIDGPPFTVHFVDNKHLFRFKKVFV